MSPRRDPGRPRPVADPVVAALASSPEEVARRWLLALVESAPLAAAARVPVDSLASDGPAFCAAVLRAVLSDDALASLVEADAYELTRLSGASDGPAAVAAAEALRRAVLAAASAELHRDDMEAIAALGDRVAHVCAQVTVAALDGGDHAPSAHEPFGEAPLHPPPPTVPPLRPAGGPGGRAAGDGAAPLWLGALERQVASGGRFGLLLVELDGADRLNLIEGPDAARELFARAGRAVRGCVRRSDLLAHEDDGRIWVIAPDAGRAGAASLAARVAEAIERAAASRGTPLTASIGIALYPDDGRGSDELTAQAEEGAYAARAAGVRVAGGPEEPAGSGPTLVS
jgi:GGDEF domain-containing protein